MQLISSERNFLIFKFRLSPRLSIHLFVNNFRTFDFCRIIENEQIYLQTLIVNIIIVKVNTIKDFTEEIN